MLASPSYLYYDCSTNGQVLVPLQVISAHITKHEKKTDILSKIATTNNPNTRENS